MEAWKIQDFNGVYDVYDAYDVFHISLHHSFLTGLLESTNDQLLTSVAS